MRRCMTSNFHRNAGLRSNWLPEAGHAFSYKYTMDIDPSSLLTLHEHPSNVIPLTYLSSFICSREFA